MLPEIPTDEFIVALEACAQGVLWETGVNQPPVDAFVVAERLGLVVAANERLSSRAQFVRLSAGAALGAPSRGGQDTIVVGPAERPERAQWAVAHEIGEGVAQRVFERLGVRADVAPPTARECVANHLASSLLLPRQWFAADGGRRDWDLAALKERFATASHELIARRMLEMSLPIVITVCDQGRITWRRGNTASRLPQLTPDERTIWQSTHATGEPTDASSDPVATGLERVRCWPVHEPDWKREIIRSEIAEN